MSDARIRNQIAHIAARLMYEREESEYFTAKRKAARTLGVDARHRPYDLPSNAEIRDQIQSLAQFFEGDQRQQNLRSMRIAAVRMMRLLAPFRPKLIGSTLTGHTRKGSDIDLHVFAASVSAITNILDDLRLPYSVERKQVRKHNETRTFTHIHVRDRFDFELTLYAPDQQSYVFKSSITGGPIESATLPQAEQLMESWYPGWQDDRDDACANDADEDARFALYRQLLVPLERVRQDPVYHPEGDALYHSLQVFELMRRERDWDEEMLLAALLHDVGKAIDSRQHVEVAVEALAEAVTPRTLWLIEHHMIAHEVRAGTIGHRARLRLQAHPDFDDLMLLQRCDQAGRVPGVHVCGVDEVLAIVRSVASEYGE